MFNAKVTDAILGRFKKKEAPMPEGGQNTEVAPMPEDAPVFDETRNAEAAPMPESQPSESEERQNQ